MHLVHFLIETPLCRKAYGKKSLKVHTSCERVSNHCKSTQNTSQNHQTSSGFAPQNELPGPRRKRQSTTNKHQRPRPQSARQPLTITSTSKRAFEAKHGFRKTRCPSASSTHDATLLAPSFVLAVYLTVVLKAENQTRSGSESGVGGILDD